MDVVPEGKRKKTKVAPHPERSPTIDELIRRLKKARSTAPLLPEGGSVPTSEITSTVNNVKLQVRTWESRHAVLYRNAITDCNSSM
jgi:hypothetical protein